MSTLLEVKDLHVAYGHVQAVKGVSFSLNEGKITSLIGANGAGKSTILLAISGIVKKTSGAIRFAGKEIGSLSPHEIVKRGVIQVAEGRAILTTLSVKENLELGAYTRSDRGSLKSDLDEVLARFPALSSRLDQMAGNLSGGEQQMLAIGRALMGRPQVLLLDEPSMGLAPIIVQKIFGILKQINAEGTTILLVEQNIRQALKVSERGYVLETGHIILSDAGPSLAQNPRVVDAYLGVGA